jgi:preprotein translocase subunit SecB
MSLLDDEWSQFLSLNGMEIVYDKTKNIEKREICEKTEEIVTEPIINNDYELLISTKTKVLFLNTVIDINNIFWNIPIIDYWKPNNGVVKKQMKIVSKTLDEYNNYQLKLEGIKFYDENIIKQIDNPSARTIKFKDERKVTIGMSKKDIMSFRSKKKNAFYNCFALIVRIKHEEKFKEFHIKVFNTGKMEIPGIVNRDIFEIVKVIVLEILQPHVQDCVLSFLENSTIDNVLINSNFNCGYFIQRDSLHNILNTKYEIESSYDPCSYPGIKCKYYFNNNIGYDIEKQTGKVDREDNNLKLNELNDSKKYTEVSFMIFRTGSCLIVGNCSEKMLRFIFDFIKNMLTEECKNICVLNQFPIVKKNNKKLKKKNITFSKEYYKDILGI